MAGIVFHYPIGATPLDRDEAEGLIPAHLTTQAQLNEWELRNILDAEEWAFSRKQKNLLSIDFMRSLHKRMLGDTWRWAGRIRWSEKTIGVAPENIAPGLTNLCADVEAQIQHKSWKPREIAARFHHRLTYIHPFPNGNGRFARTMADLLLTQLNEQRFDWGATLSGADEEVRAHYIDALRAADGHDVRALLEFLKVDRPV